MFLGSDIYCVSLQVQECCYWPDADWPSLQGSCSALTFIYPSSSAARGLPPTDYPSRCVAMFLTLSVPQECFCASDTTQECCFWHWLPPPPPPSVATILTLSPKEYCYSSDNVYPPGVLLWFWHCYECCYNSYTVYPPPPPPPSVATVLTLSTPSLECCYILTLSIPHPHPTHPCIPECCYWAIQRSWFARVNALCNLLQKKLWEVAAHFLADFWVGVALRCV